MKKLPLKLFLIISFLAIISLVFVFFFAKHKREDNRQNQASKLHEQLDSDAVTTSKNDKSAKKDINEVPKEAQKSQDEKDEKEKKQTSLKSKPESFEKAKLKKPQVKPRGQKVSEKQIIPLRGENLSPTKISSSYRGEKEEDNKTENSQAKKTIDKKVLNAEEALFIIKNGTVLALSAEGKKKLASDKKLRIPEGIKEIGPPAFASLGLEFVKLPSTLLYIREDAFFNNKISEIELPTSLEMIGRGAFDANLLTELVLPNPKCLIDGVFYNEKYVNILSANKKIKDESWQNTNINYLREELKEKKPYGSLINRGTVNVKYFDDKEELEFSYQLVSKNRQKRFVRDDDDFKDYFKIGEEVNVVALKNDYLHLANVKTIAGPESKVEFYYNSVQKAEEEAQQDAKPQIYGVKQAMLLSTKDLEADLKRDIFATDAKMNDISDRLEILNSDEIKLGTEGKYKIKYSVTDAEGNKTEASRLLYIEEENKWYPHDFYYDDNILLGLSLVGELKFNKFLVAPKDKKIDLPKLGDRGQKLDTIASAAFAGLRMRAVNIPEGYEVVRKRAFDSTLLEHLELPSSVKVIEDRAFGFTDLKTLKLPAGLVRVGERAFANTYITELVLPETLEYIGEGAFINSSKLTKRELSVPASVKYIGLSAFENCRLDKLILHEGLLHIDDAAFAKNNLTEVRLPASLEILSPGAFKQNGLASGKNYHKVKLYTKDGQNPRQFASNTFQIINPKDEVEDFTTPFGEEDFVLDEKGLSLSERGKKRIKVNKELVIPDLIGAKKVLKIAELAFLSKKLTKLVLPASVQEIGGSAFERNDLTELILPEDLRVIKNGAFLGNAKLKKLTLPSKLEKIEKNAFLNSGLEEVKLPESIKEIAKNAFKKKGKKVKLLIDFNERTRAFIEANRKRNDFTLEVLGEAKNENENAVSATLVNKLTSFGVKKGETIEFKLAGFIKAPTLMINDKQVNFIYRDDKAKISFSKYKDLLGDFLNEKELNFVFASSEGRVSQKLKIFEPEKIRLSEPNKKYKREGQITFVLASGKYPLKGILVYENPYALKPMKGVSLSGNEVSFALPAEFRENELKLYLVGDHHEKSEIVLLFEEQKTEGVSFKTIDVSEDTAHYEISGLDEDTYAKLKESFENDSISISSGRTTYSKGGDKDFLFSDEYYMEFDEGEKKIAFYLNSPSPFENLAIIFAGINWNYAFDGEKNITEE